MVKTKREFKKKNSSTKKNNTGLTRFEADFEKSIEFKNTPPDKNIIEQLSKPFSPSIIHANDDYYTYINYTWIEDTKKSVSKMKNREYFSQIDSFRLMQNKVYIELIDTVKDHIKNVDTKRSKMISHIYNSCLHLNHSSFKKNIQYEVDIYNKFIEEDNLWNFLAHINGNEVVNWSCPLVWSVTNNEKEAKIFRNNITFPELSLNDISTYFEDGDPKETEGFKIYKKLVKKKFLIHIKQIFDYCLGPNHDLNANDVFDCELEILMAFGCDGVKESGEFYNKVKKEDALKYGFDWEQFSKSLGYKKTPDFFICPSLNYLSCMCKILSENWKTPKWKSFWLYIYFKQIIRFDLKGRYIFHDFHKKFLQGQQAIFPQELYPIFMLSFTFNTFLTTEYVKNHTDDKIINYVKDLGADLLTVYKRQIRRNSWLSPSTKKSALLKLEYLNLEIAHPKKLREDPLLDYDPDDAYGNIKKLARWKSTKYILLEGQELIDRPTLDWRYLKLTGSQAYIVNAFYTATENKIYIPLAYMQKPFIDLEERGIEYNLAHLGDTLAHEMSHALDENGSKYDHKGNLNDWWSASDKKKYKIIIKDIIYQYEAHARRDGIDFDASIGIGEDMADISAVPILLEYLNDFQNKNEDIIPIKDLSFRAFFVYFAVQQRQFLYKKAFSAQLKTNPHPLDKYRTNVPLSRLALFRALYNVKKGDKMWWHNTNMIWTDSHKHIKSV